MSVHPHSSSETYFIYCVGQSIPVISAFKAAMAHAGIPAKPLLGRYKGQSEFSFISRMRDYDVIGPWLNAEESILHIHSYDARDRPRATLKYLAQGIEHDLGRMVPVSRDEALSQNAYTFDVSVRPSRSRWFTFDLRTFETSFSEHHLLPQVSMGLRQTSLLSVQIPYAAWPLLRDRRCHASIFQLSDRKCSSLLIGRVGLFVGQDCRDKTA